MNKSRANYFKERRKSRKDFGVLIDREKLETLEAKLKNENKTKTAWLNEKIDEELKK
nr:MAG TPA: replication regulatory protein [Caudoviricetes sp.]